MKTALAVIAALLVAIWPLPDTMALRNMLLLVGLGLSGVVLRNNLATLRTKGAWPLWVLFGTFVWVTVHLLFLNRNFEEQWYEYQGDWLRSLIGAVMGLAVGMVLGGHTEIANANRHYRDIRNTDILITGLAGTLVIYMVRYAYEVATTGQWLHLGFFEHPFREKPAIVVFGSVFLPAVLIRGGEAVKGSASRVWLLVAGIAVPALVFAYFTTNTKNGFLSLALTLLLFGIGVVWNGLRARRPSVAVFVTVAVILVATGYGAKLHIASNPAWGNMVEDVQEAADTEKNQAWKNRDMHKMPLNHNGVEVNGSTYDRTAWAVAALTLIRENPLGYGLINHSFGALALEKWPDFYPPNGKNRGATHSGWIDLTLGIGIPGLLLILIPLLAAAVRAKRNDGYWRRYLALTIPVVLFVYLTTEVATGHYIEFLMFFAAFAVGITLKQTTLPAHA